MIHTTKNKDVYTVYPCTTFSVNSHYELIKEYVTDIPEKMYKDRMLDSIKQNFAKKCYKNNSLVSFMYNLNRDVGTAEGVSFYSVDPIGYTTLAYEMFKEHSTVRVLLAIPHSDNLEVYKSFATQRSINDYKKKGTPIKIRIEDTTKRLSKIYHKVMLSG